jgi:N-acetylmuramoyl-L-alanine amidase
MRPLRLALAVALVLVLAAPAVAAPRVVRLNGRAYVELARVAGTLKARLDASGGATRAYLRSPGHVVALTRNWSQVLVDGRPMVLDAPVRVKNGVWLVPQTFLGQVRPRLAQKAAPIAMPSRSVMPSGLVRQAATEIMLEELRFRSYPSFTRVVVETSVPIAHRVESTGPREARIRLLSLSGGPQTEEVGDGFIEDVRLERAGGDALLRVTFEGTAGQIRTSMLADPPRLVLEFLRPEARGPRDARQAAPPPLRTIVLDAGHGGHDSGAVGPAGLMEKDLVLDVTRRVARLVDERLALKVILSRDGDHFVTLRDRTSLANRERADLFVSIHANAHREAASEGVETYFLSSEATDSAARQVAAIENGVVQLEKATARGGRNDIVRTILWDLAQSEFQLESSRLAEVVQDSMTQSLRIPNRGVKQAGFYVLGGAAMPAILVEIGFVTNPKEERKLKASGYRDEIARAIFAGLAEYKRHLDQRSRAAVERPR